MGVLTEAAALAQRINDAAFAALKAGLAGDYVPRTGALAVQVKTQVMDHAERTDLSEWMRLARLTDPAGGAMQDWRIGFDPNAPLIGLQARRLAALEQARLQLPIDAKYNAPLLQATAPRKPLLEKLSMPPHITETVAVHGVTQARYFIVHCTEDNLPLRNLYSYFRGGSGGLGTQYAISPEGVLAIAARPKDMTWHVSNLNSFCVGCELTGFDSTAWQTRVDQLLMLRWLMAWHQAQVGSTLVAAGSERTGRAFTRGNGVSEHRWLPFNDHSDPGPAFPLAAELRAAASWRDDGIPVSIANHLRAVRARA